VLTLSSCNDDEEPTVTNPPGDNNPVTLSATSMAQFSITTGGNTVQGVSGESGYESLTLSSHNIDAISTYLMGHEVSQDNGKGLTVEFGPHTSQGMATQQVFHSFVTEGPISFSSGQIRLIYRDGNGVEFFSDDLSQSGSTFTVEDVVYQGDYIRFYATFSCKLLSGANATTGYMVGALYRF